MAKADLIIRGGSLIDGQGGPARSADIAVRDGMVTEVGRVSCKGARELDAKGALVTPGFVDIHTHYDGQATWSERMSPSSHHGVTTVVMGNCGVGFAPVRAQDRDLLVELMEGVEDIPGAALHEGLPWAWESFPEYMDYLAARRYDMDIAAQLPHAALRVYVMGERGARREPANQEDCAEMRRLTEEAVRAGALGFSSSRTLNHRSSRGDPTPSLSAGHAELISIGKGVRDAGEGVLEFISDFEDLDQEFSLLCDLVRESRAPMTISLAQGLSPHGWRKLLQRIDEACAEGLVMKGQVAPRGIGVLLGLTATLNPFMACPAYRKLADLPLAERVRQLRNPEVQKQLLSEKAEGGQGLQKVIANWDKIWVLGDPPDYEPAREDSLGARARALHKRPEELALAALLLDEGRQLLYTPFANYAEFNLDCCRDMILAKNTVMGLGDGGAHVGTICDASFATFLLTHWGRDRQEGRIDLSTLVRAQSRETALAVGLHDRGLLIPGMRADINIIDFDRLGMGKPHLVQDLPAGGRRLTQETTGYIATLVRGEVTYEEGQPTRALPGRLIRGQQGRQAA